MKKKSIKEVAAECFNTSKSKGFHKKKRPNIHQKLLLIVGEVAEAQEELRKGKKPTEIYYVDGKPEGFPIELADAAIRIFDCMEAINSDIQKAIEIKMAYNKTRPYRHGKKF